MHARRVNIKEMRPRSILLYVIIISVGVNEKSPSTEVGRSLEWPERVGKYGTRCCLHLLRRQLPRTSEHTIDRVYFTYVWLSETARFVFQPRQIISSAHAQGNTG